MGCFRSSSKIAYSVLPDSQMVFERWRILDCPNIPMNAFATGHAPLDNRKWQYLKGCLKEENELCCFRGKDMDVGLSLRKADSR